MCLIKTSNRIEIQNVQLTIMDDIHRVCIEDNITYYLIGGSAIGAIRHQGFIPWDVDIDIAMPRDDYERFINITSQKLNPTHQLLYHKNCRELRSPHAVVILKNSDIVFTNDLINPSFKRFGLFVDILPLDKVPKDAQVRNWQKKQLKRLRWLMELRLMRNYYGDSPISKVIKRMLIPLINLFPMGIITSCQHKVASRWNTCEYDEVCSMLSHYAYDKLCMPKDWFATPKLVPFSGRKYCVPTEPEKYLTKLFGDYMSLPSEEEQKKYSEMVYEASYNPPVKE